MRQEFTCKLNWTEDGVVLLTAAVERLYPTPPTWAIVTASQKCLCIVTVQAKANAEQHGQLRETIC
jgi:hypothetical protein